MKKLLVFFLLFLLVTLAACNMPAQNELQSNPATEIEPAQPAAEEHTDGRAGLAAAPSGPSADLSEVSGMVQFRRAETDPFEDAGEGAKIYLDGQVQTGADGRLRLDFSDGTLVRITPNSLFTLTAIEDEDEGLLKKLFMSAGQMWIVLNGGSLEVDTPSGVAAVLGSYMMVSVDPETGFLKITCWEGTCSLKVADEEIILGAGESAWFSSEGLESGWMTEEEIQAWLDSTPEAIQVLDLVPSAVGDFVWEDLNGNGLQDEDEPGVADVTVTLLDLSGDTVATTQTDSEGHYQFYNVPAGDYLLEFFLEDTLFTVQNAGDDDELDNDADRDGKTVVFTVEAAQILAGMDAGLVYPGHAGWCPFTGLPTDGDLLDNRPIFISISKFPAWATRPAVLADAPLVFETLVDEGQTRLQALFYCGYPEKPLEAASEGGGQFDISGVRSGRVFYAELAQLFGAGLIFGGADPTVYETIAPYQCGVVDNIGIPNNIGGLGMDIESLENVAENCKHSRGNPDLYVWQFGPPPAGGEAAPNFLMHYNHLNQTRWIYEPAAGGYVRYENDPDAPETFILSTDKLSGEAIVRQNVILLEVPHNVLNSAGTIIEFDLTDERGYAWLLRDGEIHKACWSAVFDDYPTQSNRYRPFLLFDCTTKEQINFAYGSSWVNVVTPSFWFEEDGDFLVARQPFLGYGQ